MSEIVYRIASLLQRVLVSVPIGTNLGLYGLLWTLLSGRLLLSRGALFPALSDFGLNPAEVRRAEAALAYGRFDTVPLLADWQQCVLSEGQWRAHLHGGYRPLACDRIGFFRPCLADCASKHYHSAAEKALPAVVLGLAGAVGSVGKTRLCLPRTLVRQENGGETVLMRSLLSQTSATLAEDEAIVVDAGFALSLLLELGVARFVARVDKNFTARRNYLPAYKGRGRHPLYGERVRPLARTRAQKEIAASKPDRTLYWKEAGRRITAQVWYDLVPASSEPGGAGFTCVVIHDPRYKQPWVLVTNLPPSVSAYAIWRLYRDRWPIEPLPLAAKQMLGAERSFVFGKQSRLRLPELALLAGNILSYVAADSWAIPTGFWDRAARPTCGRLRRWLLRLHFAELPLPEGQLRKKASVTAHLPKGVEGHRRHKAVTKPCMKLRKAA
jgi:hypothetical protein